MPKDTAAEYRASLEAMQYAYQRNEPIFAVQSRSRPDYIEIIPAAEFYPLPDLRIVYVAYQPGWRYGQVAG